MTVSSTLCSSLRVVLDLPDFGDHVVVEAAHLFLELVEVAEDVFGQEGQHKGVVVQVVGIAYPSGVALGTHQLSSPAALLDAKMVFLTHLAAGTHLQGGLHQPQQGPHLLAAHQVALIVVGLPQVSRRTKQVREDH